MKLPLRDWTFVQLLLQFCYCVCACHAEALPGSSEASARIDRNLAERRYYIQADSQRMQEARTAVGTARSEQLLEEGRQVSSEMAHSYVGQGRQRLPMYSQSEIDNVTVQYQSRAQLEKDRAQAAAYATGRFYAQRQTFLDESAYNLERQLQARSVTSDGVMLQPLGTNLYVRNYQCVPRQTDSRPKEPVTPLVANPQAYPSVVKEQAKRQLTGKMFLPISTKALHE